MTHPSQATLSLLAGGDLGVLERWRTERHVEACETCRRAVDEFCEMRSAAAELAELPDVAWNRLAAEMKANIRLGLEAGEIVGGTRERTFPGRRILAAYAAAMLLVAAGLWLQRSTPPTDVQPADGIVLQATSAGIERKEGGQVLTLMNRRAGDVIQQVGAQGSLRARFVDAETGYVTINNVYAQ
jgi:anti-sigma factor RsiW